MTLSKQSHISNTQAWRAVKVKFYALIYLGSGNSTPSSMLRSPFSLIKPCQSASLSKKIWDKS